MPDKDPADELPTGTITYLFTDVEGSTRLWETQPEVMRLALRRHDELVAFHVETGGGRLVRSRGEGDSHFAVFDAAANAVVTAGRLQRALLAEPWPTAPPLRVRMALHTGVAESRDGTYYGGAVNRCARLRAIAHGAQVVLSGATAGLLPNSLPDGFALRDLGDHRLRDLERPERVYQLQHRDLLDVFPPLNSLDSPRLPNNLPRQVTSFIGRQAEMEELRRLVGVTPLLTLIGAGGCGKTRLALQVAAELLDDYPDGVWFADLAPLGDGALVTQTVAGALRVQTKPGQAALDAVIDWLRGRKSLLILDNCEHVLSEAAGFADAVLQNCPQARMLATSREALGVYGEQEWRVPSLLMPEPSLSPAHLLDYDAVRLFVDRVAAMRPGFTLNERNAPAVARLCHRLDGIPLALELAAVRVRALSVEQVADRLDNCFNVLTGGSRTALPRQQTLRALIDWSYDLLSLEEQMVLCRLSVFRGGWTLEAAEAVSASPEDLSGDAILDLLTSLVNKSLVIFEEADGRARYRLLETVRQYGRFRLDEAPGQASAVARRHFDHFAAWAGGTLALLSGAGQREALRELDAERDNLRAALDWAAEAPECAEEALLLAGGLARYWMRRGFDAEERERLRRLRERFGAGEPSRGRAEAANGQGILERRVARLPEAESLFRESARLFLAVGDEAGRARAVGNLGLVLMERGRLAQARPALTESLAARQRLGDDAGVADTENNLGNLAWYEGDPVAAESHYRRCLALRERLGDTEGIAALLHNLGLLALNRGDLAAAESLFGRGLTAFQRLENPGMVAHLLLSLGLVSFKKADYVTAREWLGRGLSSLRSLADERGVCSALGYLAVVSRAAEDWESANGYLRENLPLLLKFEDGKGLRDALTAVTFVALRQGRAEPRHAALLAVSERLAAEHAPAPDPETDLNAGEIKDALRRELGEETFEDGRRRGWEMGTDDAVAEAIGLLAMNKSH